MPTRYQNSPTLFVRTIPEDDEMRKTGIILLADTQVNFRAGTPLARDLLAQYKVLVSYNGVPVTPTIFYCQIIEKDKYNPLKSHQGSWENLASLPKDMSANFECKWRVGKAGVGVIDVYWVGPTGTAAVTNVGQFIADYVVVIGASYMIGRTTVYGAEIQDVCVLGWPINVGTPYVITKPDKSQHWVWSNPLGTFVSCEDAALYQKDLLGLQIPWV